MNTSPLSAPPATFADDTSTPLPPLPRDALALVVRLVSGLNDRRSSPLEASFGAQANLTVDFATRTVHLDGDAARRLDTQQALPRVVAEGHASPPTPVAAASARCVLTRDLDDVLWDIGQACRHWQLQGAGADAWQQPLEADPGVPMRRLLRLPLPLALARLMFDVDACTFTPADVQHACGLSAERTRGLLQACLFLGLLRWQGNAEGRSAPDAARVHTVAPVAAPAPDLALDIDLG